MIAGLWKSADKPIAHVTLWLRIKALGLKMLCYASFIYAMVIVSFNPKGALPATAIILIFSLTCWSRATAVTLRVEDYLEEVGAG